MTNHHCGWDYQANSTTENDYLTNGFWAMSKEQEIPAGLEFEFLNEISENCYRHCS